MGSEMCIRDRRYSMYGGNCVNRKGNVWVFTWSEHCNSIHQSSQRVTPMVGLQPPWILICLDFLASSSVRTSSAFRLLGLLRLLELLGLLANSHVCKTAAKQLQNNICKTRVQDDNCNSRLRHKNCQTATTQHNS